MEIPLLSDIVIILGLAVFVILLFQRFKLPTVLGFLITGIIAGPHGLSLVKASHEVELLAEIGVILLLFIIGMEFSLKSLVAIKRAVLLGGATQVVLTILVVAGLSSLLNYSWNEAVFLGFLFSLSSTAIVLKLLQEKAEINSPHGKAILAILIFQDIIVVPMMLFTPMIAGETDNLFLSLFILAIKGVLVIAVVYISARFVVPNLLYRIAQTKSNELFILSIVVICFAVAWLTSSIGLSLALGAFMAGLIISESEYSHQATSHILPFHEIFTSFFFVSIGMLLDLKFLINNLLVVLVLVLLTFIIKGLIASIAAKLLGYPIRTVALVGLSLFQVGEFAFILSITGIKEGLLNEITNQYFLSVSLMTMAITPFILNNYHTISRKITAVIAPKKGAISTQKLNERLSVNEEKKAYNDHIVIIGFGINGKNVAYAAKNAKIPYVILELNAVTVREERLKGEPILYGDAIQSGILGHVNIQKARVAVIAISDPVATKRIIANIREFSARVYIIVRTRFIAEMEINYKLGADEVIPEEFETSIEIFTRVLTKYLVPKDQIEQFVRNIRSDNYVMFRSLSTNGNKPNNFEIELPDVQIATLHVQQSKNSVVGRPLYKSNLRNNYGITIVGIKRSNELIDDIKADTEILQDDILYVFGKAEQIDNFNKEITIL
ncbi:MAG: cation:proton antiporter [Bacteroidota bacterium]|nr:cation:proton antiporter [Bacteroidota bacterium]